MRRRLQVYRRRPCNRLRVAVLIMGESDLAELGASLSEAKQQVLRKYLQGDATPDATRTIKPRQRAGLSAFEEIPLDRPIHLLFEDQVKRSPDSCAAVFEN